MQKLCQIFTFKNNLDASLKMKKVNHNKVNHNIINIYYFTIKTKSNNQTAFGYFYL